MKKLSLFLLSLLSVLTLSACQKEKVLDKTENIVDIQDIQLNREQIRSENKESMMNMINSGNLSDENKQDVIQDMTRLTEIAEIEIKLETSLKANGFVDPVVIINDEKVGVFINSLTLTDHDREQIEDIVIRKMGISPENIIITLVE